MAGGASGKGNKGHTAFPLVCLPCHRLPHLLPEAHGSPICGSGQVCLKTLEPLPSRSRKQMRLGSSVWLGQGLGDCVCARAEGWRCSSGCWFIHPTLMIPAAGGQGMIPEWLLSANLSEFGAECKRAQSRAATGRGAGRVRSEDPTATHRAPRSPPLLPPPCPPVCAEGRPPTRALPERVKYLPLLPSCPFPRPPPPHYARRGRTGPPEKAGGHAEGPRTGEGAGSPAAPTPAPTP